jgi:uncharacterized protein YjbJ (UPF0337 family)
VKERSTAVSGKTDQIKGRIKEAAGVLMDNDRLKRKGKLDQVVGKVKETAKPNEREYRRCLTNVMRSSLYLLVVIRLP